MCASKLVFAPKISSLCGSCRVGIFAAVKLWRDGWNLVGARCKHMQTAGTSFAQKGWSTCFCAQLMPRRPPGCRINLLGTNFHHAFNRINQRSDAAFVLGADYVVLCSLCLYTHIHSRCAHPFINLRAIKQRDIVLPVHECVSAFVQQVILFAFGSRQI